MMSHGQQGNEHKEPHHPGQQEHGNDQSGVFQQLPRIDHAGDRDEDHAVGEQADGTQDRDDVGKALAGYPAR